MSGQSDSSTNLSFDFERCDPLGWLLFRKLRCRALGVLLLAWAFGAFEMFVLYPNVDYRPTVPEYLWFTVIVPTFWTFYAVSRTRIPSLFKNLETNDIIREFTSEEYSEYIHSLKRSYAAPIWPILAFIGSSAMVAVAVLVTWRRQPPPISASPWNVVYSATFIGLNGYFGSLAVLRELSTIYWLRQAFHRFSIHVHPLDPDGAGGLGFIGNHYLGLTLFVVAVGMWLSIWYFWVPLIQGNPLNVGPESVTGWVVYLVATPASFFLPLWSTHQAMKQQKVELLEEVSAQFDLDFELVISSIEEDPKLVQQRLEKIASLQEMQRLIDKRFPTWPFNLRTLQRFSFSAILPIITSLASFAIDIFSGYTNSVNK